MCMIQYVLYPECMSNYFKESNHTNTTKLPIFSLYRPALIIPANTEQFFTLVSWLILERMGSEKCWLKKSWLSFNR